MDTTTIRVTVQTRDALSELARASGITIQEAAERAVVAYQRQRLLRESNAGYAALRAEPEAAAAWQAEADALDGTLEDGLE